MSRGEPRSLAAQNARWFAALFIAIELVTIVVTLVFVLWPLSRRAADDFVGLLMLSAQTWSELPPTTRPAFEEELALTYRVAVRPDMKPPEDSGLRHGFYVYFLERALAARLGSEVFFSDETRPDGERWLWTALPSGGRSIGIGFAASRLQTHPLVALTLAALIGAVLVAALAHRLARWIARPIARLEQAAAQLAQGVNPALLEETGPRELSSLARHFNQMATQLRELNEARTTLFAGISHDLRTPLARMRLALEMIATTPDARLIERMDNDIEVMNRLIAQLLDIARGLATEPVEEIRLCDWLEARARLHAAQADAAGTALAVRCDDALRVRVAQGMLARVLDNLIDNALRYAPGAVEVVAERVDHPPDGRPMVRIGVLDRGPSIPPDQLEAVFRPFHRVEGSRSPVTGGFGLGLAVVRQLAKANGWRVSLAPRDGGGLEAWVEVDAAT